MEAPTRAARKAATRVQLKRAARRCFGEAGLQATSIGAITRAAGVAHGTFYVHFPSKEALLDELLAEFNLDLASALAPLWDPAQALTTAARVRSSAELFLEHLVEHRDFVEIYAQRLAFGVGLEELRDGINPPAAAFLAIRLAEVATDTGRVPPHLALAAHGLLALWLRIGLQALLNPEVTRPQAVETLVHMTLGAVSGPATPNRP